jgi:hypothetical protein
MKYSLISHQKSLIRTSILIAKMVLPVLFLILYHCHESAILLHITINARWYYSLQFTKK